LSVEEVLKQLRNLQWEIYEVIKPAAEASEGLIKATQALKQLVSEALESASSLASSRRESLPPRPKGEHKSYEVDVVGEQVTWLGLEEPVHAATIFNDGPNSVLPMVNRPKKPPERKGWIAEGKSLEFRSDWPDIVEVFFVCKAGETAKVTVHTWG